MKIQKYYLIFVRLHFARQDGQDGEKSGEKNHTNKVTKILKTKIRKYGMNETLVQE